MTNHNHHNTLIYMNLTKKYIELDGIKWTVFKGYPNFDFHTLYFFNHTTKELFEFSSNSYKLLQMDISLVDESILLHISNNRFFLADQNNLIDVILLQHRGYCVKGFNFKYFIDVHLSPAFDYVSIYHRHRLCGFNIKHYLEYDNTVFEIVYNSTSILPINLLEKFINAFCIPPTAFGFTKICSSMFKVYDVVKKKVPELTKENILTELTLRKMLK